MWLFSWTMSLLPCFELSWLARPRLISSEIEGSNVRHHMNNVGPCLFKAGGGHIELGKCEF